MKVTIDITQKETREYVGRSTPESEYQETVQHDVKTLLENGGFQEVTTEDVVVNIND
ncbi:MAG: hypothetical protein LBI71_11255 [Enterobacteriaceae bacterium]|jgi:hypothetical protein|nr:hypothetical protein [Enterobacteriaceae bacterium]